MYRFGTCPRSFLAALWLFVEPQPLRVESLDLRGRQARSITVPLDRPLSQRFVEDDGDRHGQVEALDHAQHGDADDLVGEGQGLVGDALRFAAEDEDDGLSEIDLRIIDRILPQVRGQDLIAGLLQGLQAGGRGGVDGDLEPLVGPGRDGLVGPQDLGIRANEVEVEDAGGVARPHDRAGVVGDGHVLEDDPQVGLAVGEDAADLLDPLGRRHAGTIAFGGGRVYFLRFSLFARSADARQERRVKSRPDPILLNNGRFSPIVIGPRRCGGTGRRAGLKIPFGATRVWVRFPPPAPIISTT
jgi:hypothetical protein